MQPGHEVLCVGRLYCDMVFSGMEGLPVLGQESFAEAVQIGPGGGAYITAAYLARMGCGAALGAIIPAQPFGDAVMAEMSRSGVSLEACARARPQDAPQITVAMVADGDRAFLTKRTGAAIPHDLSAALSRPGLSHLHIGELTTLLEHPELIDMARARGLTISLDCAWDKDTLARTDLTDLIARVDLFLPNAEERRALTLDPAKLPNTIIVVKDGAAGAYCGALRVPARAVTPVDTTGAGDAFNAGFLAAWLAGAPIKAAMQAGAAAGAVAVTLPGGAAGVPDLRGIVTHQQAVAVQGG
ncbi:carbohydrate kinase family protein [Rubricella aquisinus]|nr:PfkB family carbohydrate kinase [Rubricella aquisinus]